MGYVCGALSGKPQERWYLFLAMLPLGAGGELILSICFTCYLRKVYFTIHFLLPGTDKHEYTSYSSMQSIFKFFKERYEETVNPSSKRKSENEQISKTATLGQGEESKVDEANQNVKLIEIDQSGAVSDTKGDDKTEAEQDASSAHQIKESAITVDEVNVDLKSEL